MTQLPCPFCGAAPELFWLIPVDGYVAGLYCPTDRCPANSVPEQSWNGDIDRALASAPMRQAALEASARWNERYCPITRGHCPIPEAGVVTKTDWGWCYENPKEAARQIDSLSAEVERLRRGQGL